MRSGECSIAGFLVLAVACLMQSSESEAKVFKIIGKNAEGLGESIQKDVEEVEKGLNNVFDMKKALQGFHIQEPNGKSGQGPEATTPVPPGPEDNKSDSEKETSLKSLIRGEFRCSLDELGLEACRQPL